MERVNLFDQARMAERLWGKLVRSCPIVVVAGENGIGSGEGGAAVNASDGGRGVECFL